MHGQVDRITRCRHTTLVVVRIISLVMIVAGSMYLIYGIGLLFVLQGMSALYSTWDNAWNPFVCGAALLAPGLVLVLFDRRIVRWLIPLLRHECPRCGYTFQGLTSPRCPECGLSTAGDEKSELDAKSAEPPGRSRP